MALEPFEPRRLIKKSAGSGVAAKWMAKWLERLESTGYACMKVHSDAAQAVEHLLKAVNGLCTADLIVQTAPVKSQASQRHVERAVRLVENQYSAILFGERERTEVEIDPTSADAARMLRHTAGLHDRYGRRKNRECLRWLCAWTPTDRKPGGVLVVSKESPRTFCVDNENSESSRRCQAH